MKRHSLNPLPKPPSRPRWANWLASLTGLLLLGVAGLTSLPAQTNPAAPVRTATTVRPESELARIGPGDVIVVSVYQEDDLNARVTVDGKGMVSLPLLGSVKVGDSTTDEAAATIRDLYGKDYLVHPQVTVAVADRAKRRFTVLGQVSRPGVYEFPPNESVTLLQAIAMAGGYTRLASPSRVTVQRQEGESLSTMRLDAQAMARNPDTPPFQVLPEDVITVTERLF